MRLAEYGWTIRYAKHANKYYFASVYKHNQFMGELNYDGVVLKVVPHRNLGLRCFKVTDGLTEFEINQLGIKHLKNILEEELNKWRSK